MNYQKCYDRLIDRARNRVLSGYVEVHHVIPRCMGGNDDPYNLVQLTAEEHFVSHQLLYKMYPSVSGLAFALVKMTGNPWGSRSNRLYGWIRRKVSEVASKQSHDLHQDPDFRKKYDDAMEKVRANPDYQVKMRAAVSKAHKGRVKSAAERANIAEAGRKRKPRVFSEQARANMAAARKKTWDERRANGTVKLIAQKTVATRRKNGSYEFSEEWRRNIGEATRKRKFDKDHVLLHGSKARSGGSAP